MSVEPVQRRGGLAVAGTVAAVAAVGWSVLVVLNRHELTTLEDRTAPVFLGGLAVVWSAVGILLARRRPGLVIGRLFLVTGLIAALDGLFGEYAARSVDLGGLPGGVAAAWIQGGLRGLTLVPITLLLLLYPDGRLLAPRWRWLAWGVLAAVPVLAIPLAGGAPQLTNYRGASVGISGLGGDLEGLLWLIGAVLVYPALVAGAAGVVVRYRRGSGLERQQLKWVGLAGLVALLALAVSAVPVPWLDEAHHLAGALLVYGLPVCVAVAILRHGLYDIDRLISRTIGYTLVVTVLVGVYLGLVLALGTAARAVTGESGDLVVALSTLAVAALFRPLRRHAQAVVDRRFNRARYDAARTVEDFGRQLRDEVALDSIVRGLRRTASATVAPSTVGLVLVGAASGDRGEPR